MTKSADSLVASAINGLYIGRPSRYERTERRADSHRKGIKHGKGNVEVGIGSNNC